MPRRRDPFPLHENTFSLTGARQCQAPKDNLDFHLKSTNEHHQEFFGSKNLTLYQRETVTDNH
ncbi:unnamed protein product, partial [Coregonus sp. 'balchen']